jgi:hypothetical protein
MSQDRQEQTKPLAAPAFPMMADQIGTPRNYLLIVFTVLGALLFAAWLLVTGTFWLGRPHLPYWKLYQYQTGKLAHDTAETIFVGDSSLGNAIDAELWTLLSGQRSLNLALTGNYGFAGSYNFIRRAMKQSKLRNVIVMNTPTIMTIRFAENAFSATRDRAEVGATERLQQYLKDTFNFTELNDAGNWLRRRLTGRSQASEVNELIIENDYGKQGPPTLNRLPPGFFSKSKIKSENVKYLQKIGELCGQERLNCLYVHGPIEKGGCEESKEYFDAVAALIATTKVRLVSDMPMCMATDEIGDSDSHVNPRYKSDFTRRYFERVSPYLVK